jgi:hypothetical protein
VKTVNWITAYAGFLALGGYLLGSLVRTRISEIAIDGSEAGLSMVDQRALRGAIFEMAASVIWAGLSFAIIDRVAPGTNTFRQFSAIGFLSPKALTVWESIALWSGLGVVVGVVIPIRCGGDRQHQRRGSSGLAAGGALLLAYVPLAFFLSLGAWFAAQPFAKRRVAVLVALGVAVTSEWILSMTRLRPGWGVIHGPETVLWVTALAGLIAARISHPDWNEAG